MFEDPADTEGLAGKRDKPAGHFNDDEAHSLLQELERNTPDEVRSQRAHFRLSVKAAVILRPGNASELLKLKVKGVTGDVAEGGCSVLFPIPTRVGDV